LFRESAFSAAFVITGVILFFDHILLINEAGFKRFLWKFRVQADFLSRFRFSGIIHGNRS
jgi:predicted glycosyltransferase